MTDKELKRLSRGELLEMLIEQAAENETKDKMLKEAIASLKERQIVIEEAGSIAEAALRLNNVFEAAQAAAEQYIENAQRLAEEQQNLIIQAANDYAEKTRREADEYKRKVCEGVDLHRQLSLARERASSDEEEY